MPGNRHPYRDRQQVRRLQARGAPVWYLLAGDEGHGFTKRANADYALATLVMFLEQTVGTVQAPAPTADPNSGSTLESD